MVIIQSNGKRGDDPTNKPSPARHDHLESQTGRGVPGPGYVVLLWMTGSPSPHHASLVTPTLLVYDPHLESQTGRSVPGPLSMVEQHTTVPCSHGAGGLGATNKRRNSGQIKCGLCHEFLMCASQSGVYASVGCIGFVLLCYANP